MIGFRELNMAEFKIDLHSHSTASKDGGISLEQYRSLINSGTIDYIAVTDHNLVARARDIQAAIGDNIIVGEEIMTQNGEVIGLYLQEVVPEGLTMSEAIARIKDQNGITYLPHPFDSRRAWKLRQTLDSVINDIDIIEVFNPRTTSLTANREAFAYAQEKDKSIAASSDSHSAGEVGRTYSVIHQKPTRENLVELLQSPELSRKQARPHHYLNPVLNILKKKVWKRK